MKYRPLKQVVANILEAPEREGLSRPLKGRGYLDAGWHSVTIMALDTERLSDQGRFTITVESLGDIHREAIWLLSKNKARISIAFRNLVQGLFGDDSVGFIEYLQQENQRHYIEALRGMKLNVLIEPGQGYVLHAVGSEFVAYDTTLGVPVGDPHPDIYKARRAAETTGLKRAYNRITATEETHGHLNFEALQNASQAITEATRAPDIDQSDLDAGRETPDQWDPFS